MSVLARTPSEVAERTPPSTYRRPPMRAARTSPGSSRRRPRRRPATPAGHPGGRTAPGARCRSPWPRSRCGRRPSSRGPAPGVRAPVVRAMALLQRADQRPERLVPARPCGSQPLAPTQGGTWRSSAARASGSEPGRNCGHGGSGPSCAASTIDSLSIPVASPALPRHDLVQRRPAAQRGGQHAARAGPDEEIDVGDGKALLQADQRAGHPGRAEHAARAQHQTGPGTATAYHPIRTKDHSRHICLRNPPARVMGLPKGNCRSRGSGG